MGTYTYEQLELKRRYTEDEARDGIREKLPANVEIDALDGPPARERSWAVCAGLEGEIGDTANVFFWVDVAKVPAPDICLVD